MALFFMSSTGNGQEKAPKLVCFSLNAAKQNITSGFRISLIDSVGFISKVWAVVYDEEKHDLILIGERKENLPSIFFDDVILSLKNVEKISSDDNPGVSIEPVDKEKYNDYQDVIYYGGIENTHTGWIYFQADLLLKRLSLGYEFAGIDGLPSEWDLILDNQKSGRLLVPWGENLSRSYFYPYKVRIVKNTNCAALLSLKIEVLTDNESLIEFDPGSLNFNYANIEEILDKYPESVSNIYVKMFTENYNEIANRHSVLHELENIMSTSSLFSTLLKTIKYPELDYWTKEYYISKFHTPEKIMTVNRGIVGTKYSASISGKINLEVEEINDVWSQLVLSKDPKYLQEAAIKSRPDTNSLTWQIPVGFGFPSEWPDTMYSFLIKSEQEFITQKSLSSKSIFNFAMKHLNDHNISSPLDVTPGWKTKTDGDNLLEISSSFVFSHGGFESYSPAKKNPFIAPGIGYAYTVYQSNLTFGTLFSLDYVYKNRYSLRVDIPVTLKLFTLDRPYDIFSDDHILELNGGIENPIIINEISLYNGISKSRSKYPSLKLVNTLEVPLSKKFDLLILKGQSGDEVDFEFSGNELITTNSINSIFRISNRFSATIDGMYLRNWAGVENNYSQYSNFSLFDISTSIRYLLDRSLGVYLILHYETDYLHRLSENRNSLIRSWVYQSRRLYFSAAFPKMNDYNIISFGYYMPNKDLFDQSGTFVLNFNFSGSRIFNIRKWF
ncbi:MAG: hypothetical protein K9I02_02990 [Haliscomenobacter sp.]|nr:hypothetical protein [Haliscomenobacter sp.]